MIKKLITISVFLALGIAIGLVGIADAAYNDITFGADTTIGAGSSHQDMVVASGGVVAGFVVGDSNDVTLTLEENSDITFESASHEVMSASCGGVYTYGSPSTLRVQWVSGCTSSTVTIGAGALTEVNVAANPLTAGAESAYTVTFRTVNALSANDIIRLDFGGGFTIATGSTVSNAAVTDDGVTITPSAVTYDAGTRKILITVNSTVVAGSIIKIILNSALVTNPAISTSTAATSGIDIYTTTSGGTTIDSKANQTAFNRVLDLVVGWNIFAPSQELESSTLVTVLAPISGSYSAIYTLAWHSNTSTMTWQAPTTIDPLYGYAIYITGSSTVKLPLDFSKETVTNSVFSRDLTHKGWHLLGFTGTDDNGYVAQTYGLDGMTVAGQEEFSSIVDLTGTNLGSQPGSHAFGAASKTEAASDTATMLFDQDFGYAIFTTADSLLLGGEREEVH